MGVEGTSTGRGGIRPWKFKVLFFGYDALIVMCCLLTLNVMIFVFKLKM